MGGTPSTQVVTVPQWRHDISCKLLWLVQGSGPVLLASNCQAKCITSLRSLSFTYSLVPGRVHLASSVLFSYMCTESKKRVKEEGIKEEEWTQGREKGPGCWTLEVAQIPNEYTTDCER